MGSDNANRSGAIRECPETRALDIELRKLGTVIIPLVALGSGNPDRIYIRQGVILFVEFKANKRELETAQKQKLEQLLKQGAECRLIRFTTDSAGNMQMRGELFNGKQLTCCQLGTCLPILLWNWLCAAPRPDQRIPTSGGGVFYADGTVRQVERFD